MVRLRTAAVNAVRGFDQVLRASHAGLSDPVLRQAQSGLEVHCAYTGAFGGIYPDDVSTKLAQFSTSPTISLILKEE
jgi:hypothetical protein